MKRSELSWYQNEALIAKEMSDKSENEIPQGIWAFKALAEFGKDIAEQLESELEPVDMSVLVDSGIDCVFEMDDQVCMSAIGVLSAIMENEYLEYSTDFWANTKHGDLRRDLCKFLSEQDWIIDE